MKDYVVVVGSLNYDIFLSLEHVPKIGETVSALSSKSGCGGKGANQAVQIAKLGIPTYMVGKVGNDQMGAALLTSLQDVGVETCYLDTVQDVGTGMGIVDVFKDGSVMAVISPGANAQMNLGDLDAVKELIQGASLLVLQLEIPMEVVVAAVQMAGEYGVKVLLNAAPAAALPQEVIQSCDYFVINEVEASFYLGETMDNTKAAERLLPEAVRKYGNCWVCTLGKEGAVIANKNGCRRIPAVMTRVVETTGAGDSFVGGFSYGLLRGMQEEEAAVFASYCSAVTIRSVGAQNAMPTREQLQNEYRI